MPASSRDMNLPVLVTLFVMGTILVYVIVVATQAWFRWEFNREFQVKVVQQPHFELNQIHTQQRAQLENGPVPLEEAMQQTIERYASRPGAE